MSSYRVVRTTIRKLDHGADCENRGYIDRDRCAECGWTAHYVPTVGLAYDEHGVALPAALLSLLEGLPGPSAGLLNGDPWTAPTREAIEAKRRELSEDALAKFLDPGMTVDDVAPDFADAVVGRALEAQS